MNLLAKFWREVRRLLYERVTLLFIALTTAETVSFCLNSEEHFVKEWQQGWNTYQNSFYFQHPEYLAKLSDENASHIMASFVNMRLYDIMPLMMLKGEEALGGTGAFQKKLSELYMTHLGQPITYDDFLAVTSFGKDNTSHRALSYPFRYNFSH